MISPNTKIIISRHARERMTERFDAFIPPYGSHSELMIVLSKMVRAGRHLTDWKRVPFYYNAISTKNGGPGTEFVSFKDEFIFICNYDELSDRLLVVTAVKKMLYYPLAGSFAVATAGGAKYLNEAKFLSNLENDAMIEYRERYGNTPKGVYAELKQEQEKQQRLRANAAKALAPQVLKQEKTEFDLDAILIHCRKPGTNKILPEINGPMYQKVMALNKSIRTCNQVGPLEQLYQARRDRLVKLGLQVQNEDVNMYLHLISVAKYQVDTSGNKKALKELDRYKTELQKLTVDETEN